MLRKRFKWFAIVGLAVLICVAPAAYAAPIQGGQAKLSALIGSDGIQCGDKLFSEFGYQYVGDMPAASGVNVSCITLAGNLGLEFQGGFLDLPGGNASDALIKYTVTVTDPDFVISDAHIQGNPKVFGTLGIMSVTDTFLPDALNIMGIADTKPGPPPTLSDFTIFATGYKTLHVQKDILAYALGETSYATMSFVDQTYSQTGVPEPGTLGLLGIGLLGFVGYGWWRQR